MIHSTFEDEHVDVHARNLSVDFRLHGKKRYGVLLLLDPEGCACCFVVLAARKTALASRLGHLGTPWRLSRH
jgi:hypothetical protein